MSECDSCGGRLIFSGEQNGLDIYRCSDCGRRHVA